MPDYKMIAAQKAVEFLKPGQVVGLGDGSTILNILSLISEDRKLMESLIITSPSDRTIARFGELGIDYRLLGETEQIDIYFDGCDTFDKGLNALKSGAGIHTLEKIAASRADQFILVGDSQKYSPVLSNLFPVVVEIFPDALASVKKRLHHGFPTAGLKLREDKDGDVLSVYGNYLLDVSFGQFPDLEGLDLKIKVMPGVANHSLFYQLATKAIIAGPNGVEVLSV